jgi:hypothetical protein
MARIVVLRFEDNDEADYYVELINRARENPSFEGQGATIELVLAAPTLFCPTSGGCGPGRVKGFARGNKYGWWICETCHKPSKSITGEKLIRSVVSQGVNLLQEKQEPASVFDEGWGVLAR